MNCLQNFIGISEGCGIESTSGLYVDMAEGLSVKSISNIDPKFLNGQNLVNQKLKLVYELLKADLSEMLGGDFVEQSIDSLISPQFCDHYLEDNPGTPGLYISAKGQKLTAIYVHAIYFRSHVAVTDLDITITDGTTDNTTVVQISAEADEEIMVIVDYTTRQNSVTITYDSSTVEPYVMSISGAKNNCGCTCVCCSDKLNIQGIDFDGTKISNYRGIRADVSLICDTEKMICLLAKSSLKMPIFYLLISEIAKEWVATDRLNYLAMQSKDWANAKSLEWRDTARDLMFSQSIGIKNFLYKAQKDCFVCSGYSYENQLPG